MQKRVLKSYSLARVGCAAVCVLLAAALGCGCAAPGTAQPPASSAPVQQTSLYDSSILEDGRLRLLSDLNGSNGSTILCGGKVLYQGSRSESLSLVPDKLTGSIDHYWRCWSDPTAPGSRSSALYDKTGTQLHFFDEDLTAERFGELLVLQHAPSFDGVYDTYGSCRVVELATGRELPVPENAYRCVIVGEFLVFNCYTRPDDLPADAYDEDSFYHTSAVVTDLDGTALLEVPHCLVSDLYDLSPLGVDWIQLELYEPDYRRVDSVLYAPATGEWISGYNQLCGEELFCFSAENGYQVLDFSDSTRPVLGTFDAPVQVFAPGIAVLWHSADGEYFYELHDLSTGEVYRLRDYAAGEDHIAAYLPDETLRIYDRRTGELLFTTLLDDFEPENTYLYFEADELLRVSNYTSSERSRYYTASGTVSALETAFETYDTIYPLTTDADGTVFYWARRIAPGGAGSLLDVIDGQGKVHIRSLANCYSFYGNAEQLPPGIFIAQKGFYYGWMDTTGQWVYCRSIFSSLPAEEGSSYYY